MKSVKSLYFLLAVLIVSAACTMSSRTEEIPPVQFNQALQVDSLAFLLDVRTPKEFGKSRISGAVMLDVMDSASFSKGLEGLDHSRCYYVYCLRGKRSQQAAEIMRERGLRAVCLQGGIHAWKNALLPVDSLSAR